VVDNLVALNVGSLHAFGVIGDDLFGREVIMLLEQRKVHASGMIRQSRDWDTPVYAKPYRGAEEQQRLDFGRFNTLAKNTEADVMKIISGTIAKLDALIINQQLARGICSDTIVASLNDIAARHPGKILLLDARSRTEEFHDMLCKLNAAEAARVCGDSNWSPNASSDRVKRHAETISRRMKKPVFITRSKQGILVFDGKQFHEIDGVKIDGPIDPVGAGDTTVAAIAAALSAGASLEEAGVLATLASAVTVQKLRQTGTATPEEILTLANQLQFT
jgi:bifunctional ADP-heptose synthase (sugar kinase/adenylyltransferase)